MKSQKIAAFIAAGMMLSSVCGGAQFPVGAAAAPKNEQQSAAPVFAAAETTPVATTTAPAVTTAAKSVTTAPKATTTAVTTTENTAHLPKEATITGVFDRLENNAIYLSNDVRFDYSAERIGEEGMKKLEQMKKGDHVTIKCIMDTYGIGTVISISEILYENPSAAVVTTAAPAVTTAAKSTTTSPKATTAAPAVTTAAKSATTAPKATTTAVITTVNPAHHPWKAEISGVFDRFENNTIYMNNDIKYYCRADEIGDEGMKKLKQIKKGDQVTIKCIIDYYSLSTIVSVSEILYEKPSTTVVTTTVTTTTDTVTTTAEAEKAASDFDYSLTEDGKGVVIKEYKGKDTAVKIPEKIEGLPVVEIGSMAFFSNDKMTSVTIPETVTVIGSNAFSGCSGLTAVTIPAKVTTLDDSAFAGCSGLTKITIPASVTKIGSQTFSSCSNLADIVIPETVTEIGGGAFRDTPWLKALQEKEPLVVVNHILIDGSTASGDVTVPAGVTAISGMAFSNCRAVTSVKLPEGVKTIGESAFYNSGVTSVTVPDGVTSIGSQAFGMCSKLTALTLPDSVKEIGGSAFMACESLKEIKLPKSLTAIGNSVFASCPALSSVEIPEGVKSIDVRAFAGCAALKEIVIPEGTESIGFAAFMMCSGLESVTIPESVKSIGPTAFSGCPKLTVRGYEGSAAETYAKQNSLTFEAIAVEPLETGDVTGDKLITVEDAQTVLNDYVRTVAGKESALSARQRKAADVNGDAAISADDAQLILLYYVQNNIAKRETSWGELLGKWGVKKIRISWREAEYPEVKKIGSRAEAEAYVAEKKKLYQLDGPDSTAVFEQASETYTEDWFKEHQLVVVLLGEGSGSISHQVTGVTEDEIQITRSSPASMTADMAAWAIVIELDKSVSISDSVKVQTSLLDWEKNAEQKS